MRIVCIGGGPAGLYFAALMKKEDPAHRITVIERNRPDDTFGFGVVFSDATLLHLRDADAPSYDAITASFAHWDDIDIHIGGEVVRSTGHGFSGLGRKALLEILQARCRELAVELRFSEEAPAPAAFADADLVLGADGVNSTVRARLADALGPEVDFRPNRFVWLGTTFPFPAFTFYFNRNQHGLFRVHAYRYAPDQSTFIIECTDDTFRRSGLDPADEDATIAYCERLFGRELDGHRLLRNRSLWRQFPIVSVRRWSHGNVVLVGDAAHTAHFSIGSGTKLALEDAIALRDALRTHPPAAGAAGVGPALRAYQDARRPVVESTQRAARTSLAWFEETERYTDLPPVQFAFSLLTRSLRVTHENLKLRDPAFVRRVDALTAAAAERQSGVRVPREPAPPPMFTPLKLRDVVLPNRIVVSPMCQYSAEDGTPDDWHLVHLGSRAMGGAALVIAEMTDVSAEARITRGCTGLWKAEHAAAWRRITDFVHARTPARIGVQLGHAGRKGSCRVPWDDGGAPLGPGEGGWPLLAPSPLPWDEGSPVPREMTRRDMDAVTADFVRATTLAVDAGFDWLELHCAHGYLLATFLSPLTNLRTDGYGGPVENRLRYPLEVFDAVRAAWPAGRPMSVRISAVDWAPGGITPEDDVAIARALKAHGCDAIDVSGGGAVATQKPAYGRLYHTPYSERIRIEAGIKTMTVGLVSSYSDVNSIIAAGRADLAVLARAHLFDPYWTRHAAADQDFPLPDWPVQYDLVSRFKPRPR